MIKMELNKICEKITEDARASADEITEAAERKAAELIKSADVKIEKDAQKITEKAPALARETYEKLISDASLLAKKQILAKKRELISSAFTDALDRLESLSADDYKKLLCKKGKEIKEKAEVEIAEKYKSDITDEFLKSVNPLLSKSEKTIDSGFCFVTGNSRFSCDFSETLERISEERAAEIASVLFSEKREG